MTRKSMERCYKYNLYVKHQDSNEWGISLMSNDFEQIKNHIEHTEKFGNVDYKLIYKSGAKK